MGKNVFAHIQDETGKLQVYAQVQGLGDKFAFWKLLDIGDFIGGEGTLFTTKTGEKTVRLSDLRILSKSLRPIPSQWYGLSDVEQRYRQRYVDLIVSEDARKVLLLRSRIVSEVRRFFEAQGFTEVETPMMQTIAGGAAARPFVTKHNALGIDLYMRIAPELYLKRLLVGGFTKVFEINRNFRGHLSPAQSRVHHARSLLGLRRFRADGADGRGTDHERGAERHGHAASRWTSRQ